MTATATAHPDAVAFLAAIIAEPGEDAHRLVFADWLDEHGEPARAEFVRVQVELAKWDRLVEALIEHYGRFPTGREVEEIAVRRIPGLKERERELWGLGEPTCPHTLPYDFDYHTDATVSRASGRNPVAVVRRGFVDEVRLTARAFTGGPCERCEAAQGEVPSDFRGLQGCPNCNGTGRTPGLAGPLFAAHPITKVVLTDKRPGHHAGGVGDRGWYVADRDCEDPDDLPPGIHARLRGGRVDLDADGRPSGWRVYPTEADALAALPPACVEYGRAG